MNNASTIHIQCKQLKGRFGTKATNPGFPNFLLICRRIFFFFFGPITLFFFPSTFMLQPNNGKFIGIGAFSYLYFFLRTFTSTKQCVRDYNTT